MRRIVIDARRPEPALIAEAVRCLTAGELVVLPTETVYGLCADPAQPGAAAKIFAAKGRPESKPLARLVSGVAQARAAGAAFPTCAQRLAERFWPGPLTLVLDTPDGPTGFRCPDHAVPLAALAALGRPLLATSANRSGARDARTAGEAETMLGVDVALILDAGPAPGGTPSSVVRVTAEGWTLLRAGALDAALRAALP